MKRSQTSVVDGSGASDSQAEEIVVIAKDDTEADKNSHSVQRPEKQVKTAGSSSSVSSDRQTKKAPLSTQRENVLRERQNLRNEIKDLQSGQKTEISKVLNEIKGDIISNHEEESKKNTAESPESVKVPKPQTQLTDSYYIQQRNKFIKTTHPYADQNLSKSDSNLWLNPRRQDFRSPLDVAILFQRRVISPFCTTCHGLLAGVAAMQFVLAYYLTGSLHDSKNLSEIFVQVYQRVALVGPACFAFLSSVCFMSILDRVDLFHVAKSDPRDWVSYRRSWIIGLAYFGGLVTNAVCFRYDHMISHHPFGNVTPADLHVTSSSEYPPDWHQDHKLSAFVPTWQILNALRCIYAISGWILLCFAQPEDLLADHLQEVKTFDLEIEAISTIENRPT